jgi:hypothetical protein
MKESAANILTTGMMKRACLGARGATASDLLVLGVAVAVYNPVSTSGVVDTDEVPPEEYTVEVAVVLGEDQSEEAS